MSNISAAKRGSSSLLVLFVVFIFVLCSLFLILYGAYVYTNIRDRVDDDFARRMSISYITNKIRACDVRGGVVVNEGNSSLRLCAEPDEAQPLYIMIYYHEGSIMEYVTQDLEPFEPEDGEVVMKADSFSVTPVPGGLAVDVGTDKGDISYTVSMKCVD